MTKKNKVYRIEKIEDLLDYTRYCVEKIIKDDKSPIEELKSKLMNSCFNIDIPKREYRDETEGNIIDELYYYEKYRKKGMIEGAQEEEKISEAIQTIVAIMDASTTEEFKDRLKTKEKQMANFNFNSILDQTNQKLKQLSKQDMVEELGKTHKMLEQMENDSIDYEGQKIPVKRLQGEEFIVVVTTIMPHCSTKRRKMGLNREEQKNKVLNRPLNPNNKCTSLVSNEMLGHTMSEYQEDELMYGYIPTNASQISLCGKYDLATVKGKNQKGEEQRGSKRSPQNRTAKDLIATTTEEHNEVVLNGIYPNYVVCFDRISEIALQKYKCLIEQYEKEGIDEKIEILLIDGKETYLPRIEEQLEKTMGRIQQEIVKTQSISKETMEQFFNKREKNLVVQTLQAINSTSYRDELWNTDRNTEKINQLINLLDEVITLAPQEYLGELLSQVELLETKTIYKRGRFCDHSLKEAIDTKKLSEIQAKLDNRLDENSTTEEIPKEMMEENMLA